MLKKVNPEWIKIVETFTLMRVGEIRGDHCIAVCFYNRWEPSPENRDHQFWSYN